jgi:hypothetical protein
MKAVRKIICYVTALPVCIFSVSSVLADRDSFYIWQQMWSDNVVTAVTAEASGTDLYPLVCVVPSAGHGLLVNIPWNRLPHDDYSYTPVIRIPLRAFRREDISDELDRITQTLISSMEPVELKKIQFDLDCPERLLSEYLKLVQSYRRKYPALRLSITALPSHLKHGIFHKLAASADYYVLQVHGIEIPETSVSKAELLNMSVVQKALCQADAVNLPYRVALPCYAYELNFDPGSKNFLFLTAEKPAGHFDALKMRSAARNEDLIELIDIIHRSQVAKGVIWFRLPVEGDRLCLPRKTIAEIQSGVLPVDDVRCRILPVSSSTIELEVYNANVIHSTRVELHIQWPDSGGSWDVFQSIDVKKTVPGKLPETIYLPMPPPQESLKIGWFRAGSNRYPEIEVILK